MMGVLNHHHQHHHHHHQIQTVEYSQKNDAESTVTLKGLEHKLINNKRKMILK